MSFSWAEQVARIPRDIGVSTGVKLTLIGRPAAAERFWVISGVCRCAPPTPYALAEPMTSEPSRFAFNYLPAPLVPDTATINHLVLDQVHGRSQSQRGHRRVAARNGHAACAHERVPLVGKLGKPLAQWPGARVLAAVPPLPVVGAGQPVVGAAVDHDRVVAELLGQRG